MEIKHVTTLVQPNKKLNRIVAMCWSNNNRKLAIADKEGSIQLYDENFELKDKYYSRSASGKKAAKQYTIKGMVFSADDSKLAIAQSDNIVFIYKLGLNWGEKKTICNKFPTTSSVTCICWPLSRSNEVIFGCIDGKVKIGNLTYNKSQTLYSADSPTVGVVASPDGHGLVSCHQDGSLYRFYFKEFSQIQSNMSVESSSVVGHQKIALHPSYPLKIVWGENIAVADLDKKIVMYNNDGEKIAQFESNFSKDFTSLCISPSGQCLVAGSYDRFFTYNYSVRKNTWEQGAEVAIPNMYSISSMTWKPDGSRLIMGNLTGGVEVFDSCLKKYKYKEFEFTFVSASSVIVKQLSTGTRIVLKSLFGYEILKVNVTRNQYLIGHTSKTLMMGDLDSCKLSEVHWLSSGKEKYFFDNPKVCLVYNEGEVSVIEYGLNEVIANFRTEHMSPYLLSVRISYPDEIVAANNEEVIAPEVEGSKKIAYLMDSHHIRILDVFSPILDAKIEHDLKIDWLELNHRGSKLLFRDKQRNLHLFDLKTQKKTTLLKYCSYVQWVPRSDVVVAQSRNDLCVWYSIEAPDRVSIVSIKGEVIDIVRSQGVTAVIVDEGATTVNYDLDEGLIEFGTAMEDQNYDRAADILEQISMAPETEAMWKRLADVVLQENKFHIAERCFAALGDISRARFLHGIVKEMKNVELEEQEKAGNPSEGGVPIFNPLEHWKVKAKLAYLRRDFKQAEKIYLEQGKVQEAIDMYDNLHMFEQSIALAVAKGLPDAQEKKTKYTNWLIKTKQEDKAAKIFESEGKYIQAIDLYLQGGFPASAANVVSKYDIGGGVNEKLLDTISNALMSNGLFKRAGEFFEKRKKIDKAIECYRKCQAFQQAVELASQYYPDLAQKLENEWGDWLVTQKQRETAIYHFMAAQEHQKAFETAIASRQWERAVQIFEKLPPKIAQIQAESLGEHFEAIEDFASAKQYYLKSGKIERALKMFEKAGIWDEVQELAEQCMSEEEMKAFYRKQAEKAEEKKQFKDAEKLYIRAGDIDVTVSMYEKYNLFDDYIRVVSQYRPSEIAAANGKVAQFLEKKGQFRRAEDHYIGAGDWKSAVHMYSRNDKWTEAIRIAKAHGTTNAWKKVAYEWANKIGGNGEAGANLLVKIGLIEEAIFFCMDKDLWEMTLDIANTSMKAKVPEIHYKYAIRLEETGRFKEAEDEYINAQAPKEALEMYIAQEDWNNAMRVAETYEPSLINHVLETQAETLFDQGEYERAENLYLKAKKPDILIMKYRSQNMIAEAKRVADMFLMDQGDDEKRSKLVEKEKENKKKNQEMENQKQEQFKVTQEQQIKTETEKRKQIEQQKQQKDDDDAKKTQNKKNIVDEVEGLIPELSNKSKIDQNKIFEIRETLKKLETQYKSGKLDGLVSKTQMKKFQKYLEATHLLWMRGTTLALKKESKDFMEIWAKVSVSLLRHSDFIPADGCYYEAGRACKECQWESMAFLFLNRFIDISEYINENSGTSSIELENSDFQGTDIPFNNIQIPKESYLSSEKMEEVTDSVLYDSINSNKDKDLPNIPCEECGSPMYVGCLNCPTCSHNYEPCIVTGYPVFTRTMIRCHNCGKAANKNDFTMFLMKQKVCPYCGVP